MLILSFESTTVSIFALPDFKTGLAAASWLVAGANHGAATLGADATVRVVPLVTLGVFSDAFRIAHSITPSLSKTRLAPVCCITSGECFLHLGGI